MKNRLKLLKKIIKLVEKRCKGINKGGKRRGRKRGIRVVDIIAIGVWYSQSGLKNLKQFCQGAEGEWLREYYPKMPEYSNLLKQLKKWGKVIKAISTEIESEGIQSIDSTGLPVCRMIRAKRHKSFKEQAKRVHSSVGVMYGIKLHLVIDERGKIIWEKLTGGDIDDREGAREAGKQIKGVMVGDKGYLSKKLKEELKERGIELIVRHRKNMIPNTAREKSLLKKRRYVETVIGRLKYLFGYTVSRFRSLSGVQTFLSLAILTHNLGL
jgi:hypothetical protein